MVEREFAVRLAEEQVQRENRRRAAAAGDTALRCAVSGVEEHALVWVVFWDSEQYVRTGDEEYRLAGNGPFLVDRVDGGLHQVGPVAYLTGEWETDYRRRVRGEQLRGPVDDLHDEVREVATSRGRVHAMHVLGARVRGLALQQLGRYVGALQDGVEPPAELVAVSEEELTPPGARQRHVVTLREGGPAHRLRAAHTE